MQNYVSLKENEFENQIKLSQESRVLFEAYIAEEARKVRDLRDIKIKLEEDKRALEDQSLIQKSDMEVLSTEIKKIQEETEVEKFNRGNESLRDIH